MVTMPYVRVHVLLRCANVAKRKVNTLKYWSEDGRVMGGCGGIGVWSRCVE